MMRFVHAVPFLAVFTLLATGGCTQKATLDPALVAEHRSRLLLDEEPEEVQTVLEVHETMFGEEPDDHDHDHGEHAHDGSVDHDHEHGDADSSDHDHEGRDDHASHDHEHADHEHAEGDHDHADHDHPHEPVVDRLDVALVGSVGGVPNPSQQASPEFPFVEGQAVFFLVDPAFAAEMEEHAHQHAEGEECAFCAAHAADSAHAIAVVQFADKQGQPLPVDVRDLFDLEEKATVVVRGTAKAAPNGMITVDATGLYVRR